MNDPTLDKIINTIVRAVRPDRIILFGSRARGDARPDSDYDLVVIKEGEMDEHATSANVYVSLARDRSIIVPVDIIPVSGAGFKERSERTSSPVFAAAREGITVYAG